MTRQPTEPSAESADFGFRQVPRGEKAGLVRGVFDSVARRYDLMNDLMSGGVHRLWKSAMIDWLAPRPGMRVIDVAGGTGDIAFRIARRMARRAAPVADSAPVTGNGPVTDNGPAVTICDLSGEMLSVGRDRALARGLGRKIAWVRADAEALPLPPGGADAYTIAFGIRNVSSIETVLAEAWRVLGPGGRFLCLEFSTLALPGLDRLYEQYSFRVIPAIGRFIAGDRPAYQYLVESIRRFPNQETFAGMIREAGFANVKYRNLSGGVAALHSGWKL